MKHAGPDAFARLARFLAELRRREVLVEKRPGVFYRKSRAFLHFHDDPSGLFADVRLDAGFERHEVTTAAQQRALLVRIDRALGP